MGVVRSLGVGSTPVYKALLFGRFHSPLQPFICAKPFQLSGPTMKLAGFCFVLALAGSAFLGWHNVDAMPTACYGDCLTVFFNCIRSYDSRGMIDLCCSKYRQCVHKNCPLVQVPCGQSRSKKGSWNKKSDNGQSYQPNAGRYEEYGFPV